MKEYNHSVDIALARSNKNQADLVARVPQRWFNDMKIKLIQPVCAFAVGKLSPEN